MAGIAPRIAYEIEEDGAMAGLVAGNFGIAVMPEVPVLKYLDVKTLNITDPVIERYIYMAQIKGQYQPPVLKICNRYSTLYSIAPIFSMKLIICC